MPRSTRTLLLLRWCCPLCDRRQRPTASRLYSNAQCHCITAHVTLPPDNPIPSHPCMPVYSACLTLTCGGGNVNRGHACSAMVQGNTRAVGAATVN